MFLQCKPNLYQLIFISIIDASGKKVNNQRVFFKQIIKSLILKIENRLLHGLKKVVSSQALFYKGKKTILICKMRNFHKQWKPKVLTQESKNVTTVRCEEKTQKNPNLYIFSPIHICPHYICSLTHSLFDVIQIFEGEKKIERKKYLPVKLA